MVEPKSRRKASYAIGLPRRIAAPAQSVVRLLGSATAACPARPMSGPSAPYPDAIPVSQESGTLRLRGRLPSHCCVDALDGTRKIILRDLTIDGRF